MRSYEKLGLSALLSFLLLTLPSHADLSSETPDLCQRNRAFQQNGSMYCAPVAVSNTMHWLAQNGFPNLAKESQVETAKTLARAMGTDRDGTGALEVVKGLQRYLREAGYGGKVSYIGWRSAKNRSKKRTKVKAQFLESGLGSGRGVWINIGWYSKTKDKYRRNGGHWVTVVGARSGFDGITLKVHDPSPRSGTQKTTQTVVLEKMKSGTLLGKYKGLPMSASGLYKVRSGLRMSKRHDTAILDGAVVLKLDKA